MDTKLRAEYLRQRRTGWQAKWALANARTILRWKDLDGYVVNEDQREAGDEFEPYAGYGRVRIKVCYDSDAQPWDIDATQRVIDAEVERANRDGCFGIVGEYWNGEEWEQADSVWGFIGSDWQNSGYDTDIMRSAIEALETHAAAEARGIEASRPDLYTYSGVAGL